MIIHKFAYRKPNYLTPLDPSRIDTIVIHHTGNDNSIYTNTDYHIDENAWSWLGYNAYITNEKIYEVRGMFQGAGVRSHNHHIFNIAVQGNYDKKELSNGDRKALNYAIEYYSKKLPNLKYIKVHSDLDNRTGCAGANINKYYSNNRYKVKVESDLAMKNFILEEENKQLKIKIEMLKDDIDRRKLRNMSLWKRIIEYKRKKRG